MREGWTKATLGAVCDVQSGAGFPENLQGGVGERYPFYKVSDMNLPGNETVMVAANNSVSEPVRRQLRARVFPPGSILFPKVGGAIFTNKKRLASLECCVDNNIMGLIPKPEYVGSRYMFYYMHLIDIVDFSNRANPPSIRQTTVEAWPICLPRSISEQNRIVAILDEAFEGIGTAVANAEKNLANARELFESYLQNAFDSRQGWKKKTLQQVSLNFGRGKSKHRPRNDPKLYGGPYPFIQTGEVRNCDHVILESTQTYNEAGLAQSKLWPKGTICITIAANIAETGILGFDACFPDSIIGMVVDDSETSNDFVEYLLQSIKVQLKAQGKGSAQDNINLATFEDRRFSFPSLTRQKEIVGTLNELSGKLQQLEKIFEQKLFDLSELRQSILCKAFAGELTTFPKRVLEEVAA